MSLKTIHYNNNLLYLAAIENNIESISMVNNLFNRGYPKSLNEISNKIKKTGSKEDLNKVITSYHNATVHLIKDLIKHPKDFQMLTHCLYFLIKNEKFKWIYREAQSICGEAFYYGNIKAFELLCDVLGKEHLCDQKSLLWYLHQARRNKALSKKVKEELCTYIEGFGIDWSKANLCLVRWANMNRSLEDFQYFYNKRKSGLRNNPQNQQILKKELSKSIEAFLLWSIDVETNLHNPILTYIANRKEFTRVNPYEGYWVILRKCFSISRHFEVDFTAMEVFFHRLLNSDPNVIKYLSKSKARIPQFNNIIEKVKLKEKLSNNLSISTKKNVIQKI
jgi:hypothetical protein